MNCSHRVLGTLVLLATCAGAQGQSGVSVAVDQFGVGSVYRQGSITGVRLKLTSNLSQPTPVWVQWEVPNADGDIGEYGRSLTVTPNQSAFTWVYAPLPPDANNSTVWTVRVFEERDGQRQSEVGGDRISPGSGGAQQSVDLGTNMIGVVGQARMGLQQYETQSSPVARSPRPIGSHEDTRIAWGITPAQLPDRWYGLMGLEALAWSGDAAKPQDLGLDQAEALREYVRRGGHLIISLPEAGNPWGLGAIGQTEIDDLLPCRVPGQVPRRDEAVPLADLLPALSKYSRVESLTSRRPPEFTVRVFKELRGEFNVIDNHYEPLIALDDGRVVAIQRWFGFGRITVIGIDLSDGRLTGLELPQADAFWNRVLGRRVDTPSAGELAAIHKDERLSRSDLNHENALGSGPLITEVINMRGQAGQGLLLAILVFGVYWLLAGPLGFALLKHYGYARHAWLAFGACIVLFTAISWGGVSLFPKRLRISHVTFLDHIARLPDDVRPQEPQYQRGVSFISAYLPDYGPTPINIESVDDQRDLLMPWFPPGQISQPFPNVDRFRVDVARRPNSLALPARSTATQLYAHWMGGLDREWGGTLRIDANMPIRIIGDSVSEQSLAGRIFNELPGTLTNVTVIWVRSDRLLRRQYMTVEDVDQPWVTTGSSGSPLNQTRVWRLSAANNWSQGQPLDLGQLKAGDEFQFRTFVQRRYIDPYAKRDITGAAAGSTSISDINRRDYMEIMSIFQQLNPPEYLKSPGGQNLEASVAFHRELGRELDISPWLNRPCLIIMGFLEDADLPIPLRIDDDAELPVTRSVTMVRWICPLPLNERIAFRNVHEGRD